MLNSATTLIAEYVRRKGRKTSLKHFQRYVWSNAIHQLTVDVLVDFVSYIKRKERWALGTRRRYISEILMFHKWLVLNGKITTSYQEELRLRDAARLPRYSQLPKTPPQGQAEKAVDRARQLAGTRFSSKREKLEALRNYALVTSLYSTGARISEVLSLCVADIVGGKAKVVGKGNKERILFFNTEALDAIHCYLDRRRNVQGDDPLFIRHDKGVGDRVCRLGAASARNIVRFLSDGQMTPHGFRHNFAVKLLSETHDLALTQDLLGHADPKTTRRYAVLADDYLEAGYERAFAREPFGSRSSK